MATVVIQVAGNNITTDILYESASFESQMGALPGTFELTVKDSNHIYSFTTGDQVTLDVDGTRLYGGYVTSVARKFAFPVDLTANPDNVRTRQWVLRGVDYNVLFDKRVLRNTDDYEHHLDVYPAGSEIGALVRNPLCSDYLDIPSGFDTTSQVTATTTDAPDEPGTFVEQGSTWRKQMEDFSRWGVVYYINAQKQLYVKEVEDSLARWQFSDKPNRYPIPSGYSYLPTVGFREGEFTEDGTLIVNDALVWGGSEWSNGLVFARRQNAASIAARGRWQIAETHFGEYKKQARVTARANVIVDGSVSGTSGALTRGYVNPQRMAKVTWFAHHVPVDPNLGGARSHLRPGDITTFILYALGSNAAHPLILDLPLRSIQITFPGLDPQGNGYVQFEGTFGLQLSDPWWLWKYLRDRKNDVQQTIVATINDSNVSGGGGDGGSVSYGTSGGFTLTPAPTGSSTVFYLPNNYGYINGTTEVYVNGLRYFSPANYTESDPANGEITFGVAPASTDQLYIVAQLVSSAGTVTVSTNAPTVTHEYSGTGSGLQSYINSVPDGAVIGLVANQTYSISGMITISGRDDLAIVGRGAMIDQTVRATTEVIQINGGSTNIQMWDLVIRGRNPNPGKWNITYEHNHGIALRGIHGFTASNVSIVNIGGDGVYVSGLIDTNRQSAHVRYTRGYMSGIGRNGVAITDGYDVIVNLSTFQLIGLHTFDIEPNGLTLEGLASGAVDCAFTDNEIGAKPYGDYPSDMSQQLGYMAVGTGSSGGGPAKRITISRNHITGGDMRVAAFDNSMVNEDWVVQNNTSTVDFVSNSELNKVVQIFGCVDVTVTGNTQNVVSGTFVTTSGCSGTIVTSPNTT